MGSNFTISANIGNNCKESKPYEDEPVHQPHCWARWAAPLTTSLIVPFLRNPLLFKLLLPGYEKDNHASMVYKYFILFFKALFVHTFSNLKIWLDFLIAKNVRRREAWWLFSLLSMKHFISLSPLCWQIISQWTRQFFVQVSI